MADNDTTPGSEAAPQGERLQKVMAAAGIASRRVSEDLIAAGRVTVNGEVVTSAGRRVDPAVDKVVVDGQAVQLDPTRRYLMLNKPVGVVSSLRDERGRPDLTEFTRHYPERLFNVGRLDAETSGLLILTNDGELAHILAHPSFGVTKTYIAKVEGSITPTTAKKLVAGIDLDDGPITADSARVVDRGTGQAGGTSIVEITLHSGRNRIVRRMLDAVGHPVVDLVRRQFGPLHLGSLRVGEVRDLTRDELGDILTIARDAGVGAAEPSAVAAAAVQESMDDSGVELVADVDDDVAESEKEYYDEDDEEYEPDLDAREESRRGRASAQGGSGQNGSGQGGAGGGAGQADRREPKKQYDSDGNRRVAVNGDVTGGRATTPSRRSQVRRQQEERRRGSGR
ncbi:rRNA pseudouridine synthase [Frondihabitans sp. VKM Ac-2883]|nr:rRNA pseudouridine synthase [Frondihabitans sp. VKM Ac-2883]